MTFPRVLITLLIGVMVSLAPLAQASPPDQTWLGGWYDDGDYDDVVLGVTSAVGALESAPAAILSPLAAMVDVAAPLPLPRHDSDDFVVVLLRAPPLGG